MLREPPTTRIRRTRPFGLILVTSLCCWLSAGTLASAQNGSPVSIEPKPAAGLAPSSDREDVMVLLEGAPLHLRLNVSLGGISLAQSRRDYVAKMMTALDTDKDGKLTRTEADRSPILRTKQRPGAREFLDSLRAQTVLTPRDLTQKINAIGGEFVAPRDEMTSGKNDVEVFKLLDTNSNGMLDAAEIAAATELIMSKDEDGDQCVAFQEFIPPPQPVDPMQAALIAANPPIPTLAGVSKLIRKANDVTLGSRLVKLYDKNRDFALDQTELGWTSERISALDGDGNGKLDGQELARWPSGIPDVDMSVELRSAETSGGLIGVAGSLVKRLDDASRPDYAKVSFAGAVVTFSHRNLDPITSSIETAMRQFNTMDADANGYLSRDEVAERIRFQRELFDLMDTDGDNKVFADEMKEYVRARAEPKASTCNMNLYDTGNGFFMALDTNADGRVSEREKRNAAAALAALDRDGKPGISQTEPVRHFHIEFVRGNLPLFGPSEQLLATTPAFQQRTPTGPIWFQRMDRNNDGDLVWNEFFGHIELFHELDIDHDELLDPQEAAKAK
jgi:Ca2+-binding EF-hand superfamily protein